MYIHWLIVFVLCFGAYVGEGIFATAVPWELFSQLLCATSLLMVAARARNPQMGL